jgi:hypothetical protein
MYWLIYSERVYVVTCSRSTPTIKSDHFPRQHQLFHISEGHAVYSEKWQLNFKYISDVRLKFFTLLGIKATVFYVVMPCSLVDG